MLEGDMLTKPLKADIGLFLRGLLMFREPFR